MGFPKEEIGLRDTLPEDTAGYVVLGMRVIREACKDAKYKRGARRRTAIRWLETHNRRDEGTLGWYLDHLEACGVSLPPRHWFRTLVEECNAGVKWRRDKGKKDVKILPPNYEGLARG